MALKFAASIVFSLIPTLALCQDLLFPSEQWEETNTYLNQSSESDYEAILDGNPRFEPLAVYNSGSLLRQLSRPVGKLRIRFDSGEFTSCTATLVAVDRILTNHHCIPGDGKYGSVLEADFELGYYSIARNEDYGRFHVDIDPVETSDPFDISLLAVEREAGKRYGWAEVSLRDLQEGEDLKVVHHPAGRVKHVTRARCYAGPVTNGDIAHFAHKCDTLPGSSGAPIFDSSNQIVALHCCGEAPVGTEDFNFGKLLGIAATRIPSLVTLTPLMPNDSQVDDGNIELPQFRKIKIADVRGMRSISYLRLAGDGNLLIGGPVHANVSRDQGSGVRTFRITKADLRGNEIWTNTFSLELPFHVQSFEETGDGGVLLSGQVTSPKKYSQGTFQADSFVSKLDKNGHTIWSHSFDTGDWEHLRHSIELSDGTYISVGLTQNPGANGLLLVRIDGNGNILSNVSKTDRYMTATKVSEISIEKFLVAGQIYSENEADGWYAVLNGDGSFLWDQKVGGGDYDGFQGFLLDKASIVLIGEKLSTENDGRLWLLKTDLVGKMEWSKYYHLGGVLSRATKVFSGRADEYTIFGSTYDGTAHWHSFVLKLDADGTEVGRYIDSEQGFHRGVVQLNEVTFLVGSGDVGSPEISEVIVP